MPRTNRNVVAPDGVSTTLHCYSRCVRRAFLCGEDSQTGRNYDHRKQWMEDRIEFLASVYAIDILSFAVMSNHFHLICRTRPNISATWDDQEVARRWYRLNPKRRKQDGSPATPTQLELDEILDIDLLDDPKGPNPRAVELRRRLQNISHFMKDLCQPIARRSNKEDGVTGSFFEGRFKAQKLCDEPSLLACSIYVDLNPIRAGIAKTPETSKHTSVFKRIHTRRRIPSSHHYNKDCHASKKTKTGSSSFLVPISLLVQTPKDESGRDDFEMPCKHSYRASNKGFLRMGLEKYLALVDWTGRQVRKEKSGSIPNDLAPILERLNLDGESWLQCIKRFHLWRGWAVGSTKSLQSEKARTGGQRQPGMGMASAQFG